MDLTTEITELQKSENNGTSQPTLGGSRRKHKKGSKSRRSKKRGGSKRNKSSKCRSRKRKH